MTDEKYRRLMWKKLFDCLRKGHYWVYAQDRKLYCWNCFHRFWSFWTFRNALGYLRGGT